MKYINFILVAIVGLMFTEKVSGADGHWTTSWATATESQSAAYLPPKVLKHNTLRQFVRNSIGGKVVRLRFSNAYGTTPVTLNSVHIALAASVDSSASVGDIDISTDTRLKFGGVPSVVIPPGGEIYSDLIRFDLLPLSNLAVSIHYGEIAHSPVTGHRGARTTSFIADGNALSDGDCSEADRIDTWYTLTGIEVLAPVSSNSVIAIGDSITDGSGTHYNYNTRWTDYLATRLSSYAPTEGVGVANMGIGGTGYSLALSRFRRDVLEQNGARWLVVFIGVNDIGSGKSASDVIAAYTSMANQAHGRGLKVYGATITPFGGSIYDSPAHESTRQEVNAWIRSTAISSGIYDGCLDFDAAVRDPIDHAVLLPKYSTDNLHLTPAGYNALSTSIDLTLFIN